MSKKVEAPVCETGAAKQVIEDNITSLQQTCKANGVNLTVSHKGLLLPESKLEVVK